jgi:hypothetical protein
VEQAAAELAVSKTVVRRLVAEHLLPATQVASSAPWIIARTDLSLPVVQAEVDAVHRGRGSHQQQREQPEFPWK